jgi:hypothetical protein
MRCGHGNTSGASFKNERGAGWVLRSESLKTSIPTAIPGVSVPYFRSSRNDPDSLEFAARTHKKARKQAVRFTAEMMQPPFSLAISTKSTLH